MKKNIEKPICCEGLSLLYCLGGNCPVYRETYARLTVVRPSGSAFGEMMRPPVEIEEVLKQVAEDTRLKRSSDNK